ncbi:hypothetical protein ACFLTQ_00195 [Chloroflexota bacterium]
MVHIPPDVAIKAAIQPGSVYYFPEDSFNTEEPHYFVVINLDPSEDTVIILVCSSSRIEKVRQRRIVFPSNTLVEISPEQYCDFKVDSIIDCNYILEKNIEQLVEKLSQGNLLLKSEMNIEIVKKLREGVLDSPIIEDRIKKLLAYDQSS